MKKYVLLTLAVMGYFYIEPKKILNIIPHYTIEKRNIEFEYQWGKTKFFIRAPKAIMKIPYFFNSFPKDIELFHPHISIIQNSKAAPLIFLRCLKIHHGNYTDINNVDLEISDSFKAYYKNFSINLIPSKKFGWKGAIFWNQNNIGDFLLKLDKDKAIFYTYGKTPSFLSYLKQEPFVISGEIQNDTFFKVRGECNHFITRLKGSLEKIIYRIDYGKTHLNGDFSFSDKKYHFTISEPEYLKEKINFIIPKVSLISVRGKGDEFMEVKTDYGYFQYYLIKNYFKIISNIKDLPTIQGNLSIQANILSDNYKLDGSLKGEFDHFNFQGQWEKGKGYLKCNDQNDSINWDFFDKEKGKIFYKTQDYHMKTEYKRENKILLFPSLHFNSKNWTLSGKGFYDKKAHFDCSFDAKTLSHETKNDTSSFLISFLKNYIVDVFLKSDGNIKVNIKDYVFNNYRASDIKGNVKFKNNSIYTNNIKGSFQGGAFGLQSSYHHEKLSFHITGKDFNLVLFHTSFEKGIVKNFSITGHTIKDQKINKLCADWTAEGSDIILNWDMFSHTPIENILLSGNIKNGILKGKTKKLISSNLSTDARFIISLVKNRISASLKGKLNNKSFKTSIKGDLSNPQIIQQKK